MYRYSFRWLIGTKRSKAGGELRRASCWNSVTHEWTALDHLFWSPMTAFSDDNFGDSRVAFLMSLINGLVFISENPPNPGCFLRALFYLKLRWIQSVCQIQTERFIRESSTNVSRNNAQTVVQSDSSDNLIALFGHWPRPEAAPADDARSGWREVAFMVFA